MTTKRAIENLRANDVDLEEAFKLLRSWKAVAYRLSSSIAGARRELGDLEVRHGKLVERRGRKKAHWSW